MNSMKSILLYGIMIILLLLAASCTKSFRPRAVAKYSNYKGNYFGQTPPGLTPKVFAPNFISTGLNERDASFMPDGNEFYFSIYGRSNGVIVFVKSTDDKWTKPEVVSFSGKYSDLEPFVSPGGQKLFFVSNRPLTAGDSSADYNIWYSVRSGDNWEVPIALGPKINSPGNEFYPSVTSDGTLYFTAAYDNSKGSEDIYRSKLVDGEYTAPENVGDAVNSKFDEFNAYVSPDEKLIIFSSWGRQGSFGRGDLYASFMQQKGKWSNAKNLGSGINSSFIDYCPTITPDGKYLIFTSQRAALGFGDASELTYEKLTGFLFSPKNGNGDLYWVSTDVLNKLRE